MKIIKCYIKFIIAALRAGLSVKEIHNIFIKINEAARELKLKTYELTGVYLALSQMVSKGKTEK